MQDYARSQIAQLCANILGARLRGRGRDLELERKRTDEIETDRPALQEAEQLLANRSSAKQLEQSAAQLEVEAPFVVPPGLFESIYDREQAKTVLEQALRSPRPVHVLLVGNAGAGKSALLGRIAQLPRSRYAVGGATTSAGLIAYLVETPDTRNLVIDELDKADPADLYALYSLMESGILTRLQHANRDEQIRRVWVFAGCNSTAKLPPALRSRFVELELADYGLDEVREIGRRQLEREGMPAARARAIADAVSRRSRDPRDIIQAGRLAGESVEVDVVANQVRPRRQ